MRVVTVVLLAAGTAWAQPVDPVVATIGQEKLTQSALEALFDALEPEERGSYPGPRVEQLRAFLAEYVRREPFVRDAAAQGMEDSPSVEAARALARSRTLYQEYLERTVLPTQFSDEQVDEAYLRHRERFLRPGFVRIQQITVQVGAAPNLSNPDRDDAISEADVRAKRAAIDEALETGEDFGTLAGLRSEDRFAPDDGRLPWLNPEQLPETFRFQIEAVENGNPSPWFQSPYGWHRIVVLEREPGGLIPLDEVRTEVLLLLAQENVEEVQETLDALRTKLSVRHGVEAHPERIRTR